MNAHTPHWHGNTLMWAGQRLDVVGYAPYVNKATSKLSFSLQISVLPAETKSLNMTVDNPGDWVHHCAVVNHGAKGMVVKYHARE